MERIPEHLICPICMEGYTDRVLQCVEGHAMCCTCYERLPNPKKCPSCRVYMDQCIRNRIVENLAAERLVKCRWKGCSYVCTWKELQEEHSQICVRRPVCCLLPGCGWKGYGDEDFDEHRKKQHGRMMFVHIDSVFYIDQGLSIDSRGTILLNCAGKFYALCWDMESVHGCDLALVFRVFSMSHEETGFTLTFGDDVTVESITANSSCGRCLNVLHWDESYSGRYTGANIRLELYPYRR